MKKRIISLLMAAALSVTFLAGCGQTENQNHSSQESSLPQSSEVSKAESEITVTDQAGRTVTLEKPAEKLVSTYYISTALLIALDCEDNLVGIEKKADTRELYKLAAPQLLNLPAVGSGKGINIEEIAALTPDVVIIPKRLEESVPNLEALDIPVVVVNPETQKEFEDCVSLLAEITGQQEKGEKLLTYYHEKMEFARELTKDAERPAVYLSSGSDYLSTCTSKMYQNELIQMAGGRNVSEELTDSYWTAISAEQLLAWNPDYIFAVSYAEYGLEQFTGNSVLSGTSAVQNGKVLTFPSEIEAWDYPAPSSVLGVLWLTSALHPELYSREDYLEDASAFYKEFFGIEVTEKALGL